MSCPTTELKKLITQFKLLKQKIDEVSDKFNLTKKYPGYFNKNIFRACLLICATLFIITLLQNNLSNFYAYAECKSQEPCKNPYYVCQPGDTDCVIKEFVPDKLKPIVEQYGELKQLQPGQIIGNKPNFLAYHFNSICVLIVIISFSINHLLYKIKRT